jgi:hypothetical protein
VVVGQEEMPYKELQVLAALVAVEAEAVLLQVTHIRPVVMVVLA